MTTSLVVTKDTPSILCVEVPGTIKNNASNVITALGGERVLYEAISTNLNGTAGGSMLRNSTASEIKLRIAENDKFSKFLIASIASRSDLLVKVKRKGNEIVSINVVGLVTKKAVFDSLADFYFIPPDINRDACFDVEKEMVSSFPSFVPPPIYTRFIHPIKSIFSVSKTDKSAVSTFPYKETDLEQSEETTPQETNCIQEDETTKLKPVETKIKESRNMKYGLLNLVCRFDQPVPTNPRPLLKNFEIDADLLKAYEKLFEERPLWTRNHLNVAVKLNVSDWKRKQVFARICYYISDGPWRGLMCKLGYDPKIDQSSRIYQSIDFRDPFYRSNSKLKQLPSIPVSEKAESNNLLLNEIKFLSPPSRPAVLYQLCDIEDAAVQKVINTAQVLTECSKETGWYSQNTLKQVRDLMTVICHQMRVATRSASA